MSATNEVKRDYEVCANGIAPTKTVRTGRASYYCAECGRDVSMAVLLIAEAEMKENERG